MLTFLKDLFLWLWKKILYVFLPVVGWFVWFFENLGQFWNDAWEWIFSSVKWYFQDFYLWLFSKLTEMLTSFFSGNDFIVGVVEFSNDTFLAMNVFVPMNELCVCVVLIITTMISVFLIRVIFKSIPTFW